CSCMWSRTTVSPATWLSRRWPSVWSRRSRRRRSSPPPSGRSTRSPQASWSRSSPSTRGRRSASSSTTSRRAVTRPTRAMPTRESASRRARRPTARSSSGRTPGSRWPSCATRCRSPTSTCRPPARSSARGTSFPQRSAGSSGATAAWSASAFRPNWCRPSRETSSPIPTATATSRPRACSRPRTTGTVCSFVWGTRRRRRSSPTEPSRSRRVSSRWLRAPRGGRWSRAGSGASWSSSCAAEAPPRDSVTRHPGRPSSSPGCRY
ncbi:MAG: hypothetical protein AVDCRST_MAG53-2322, partial [uncultured Solirubrobacteraceae bacterium]